MGMDESGGAAAPGRSDASVRIRLFNVKYSPNLGDGLLSECLERALVAAGAREAVSTDLSARTRYAPGARGRSTLLAALERVPQPLRGVAVRVPLTIEARRRWGPHYRAALAGADAVVIGGGNLFTDMDLNFPTKLALAIDAVAAAGLPLAIYGVGVGETWSRAGVGMVRRALERVRLVSVAVRDEASAVRFARHFGTPAGPVAVVRDPGLLASRSYPRPAASGAVGLCVTSAVAVRYHSALTTGDAALADVYVALAGALAGAGRPLLAFTNGSPEDEAFLDAIAPRLAAAGAERRRVNDPAELVALIGGLDALIAHRMHALIAAYSFGVPIHPLAWDTKVDAFAASVGAPAPVVADAAAVPGLVAAVRTGGRGDPDAVVAAAARDVATLYGTLTAAR